MAIEATKFRRPTHALEVTLRVDAPFAENVRELEFFADLTGDPRWARAAKALNYEKPGRSLDHELIAQDSKALAEVRAMQITSPHLTETAVLANVVRRYWPNWETPGQTKPGSHIRRLRDKLRALERQAAQLHRK